VARIAAALPPAERRYHSGPFLIDRREANAFALPAGGFSSSPACWIAFNGRKSWPVCSRMKWPMSPGATACENSSPRRRALLCPAPVRQRPAGGVVRHQCRLPVAVSQNYSGTSNARPTRLEWHYLLAANIDPRGLADFFQLLTEGENTNHHPPDVSQPPRHRRTHGFAEQTLGEQRPQDRLMDCRPNSAGIDAPRYNFRSKNILPCRSGAE